MSQRYAWIRSLSHLKDRRKIACYFALYLAVAYSCLFVFGTVLDFVSLVALPYLNPFNLIILSIVCFLAGFVSSRRLKKWANGKEVQFNIERYFDPMSEMAFYWLPAIIYFLLAIIFELDSRLYIGYLLGFAPVITAILSFPLLRFIPVRNKTEINAPVIKTTLPPAVAPASYYNGTVMPTGDAHIPRSVSHGSARWLTDNEKNNLTAFKNFNQPFAGLWLGGGFFHHKEGHLITAAPPGKGKGAALIIPNLLLERGHKHSFVVFDPKGTNACITARFQKDILKKRVIIIDPMGLQKLNKAKHGIASSCFNPLDHIGEDIFNGTSQIANLLLPDNPKSTDKFFDNEARNLLHTLLMHIMTSPEFDGDRNLVTLQNLIVAADPIDLLNGAQENKALSGIISLTAKSFIHMINKSHETFGSVRSVAASSVKWLGNPTIQAIVKSSDFVPSELENGNVALYLCQPIQNKEGFATLSRLIVGLCLRANAMPSHKPKEWVYYLLDEFPTMGIFPEVTEALAFSREYKMRLWLFVQSLSQLDVIYGQEGRNTIVGSCGVFQAFGISDQVTQYYISSRIGRTTETFTKYTTSEGQSEGQAHNSGDSHTTTWNGLDRTTAHASSTGTSHNTERNRGFSQSEEERGRELITPSETEKDPHILTLTEDGSMRLVRWPYFKLFNIPCGKYYYDIMNDGRADNNPNFDTDIPVPTTQIGNKITITLNK